MKYYITSFLILLNSLLFGQSSVPNYILPASACLEETLLIENLTLSPVKYEWDFCLGDFGSSPIISNDFLPSTISTIYGLKILKDGNRYLGFATGANASLFRLEFGNSITNNPVVTNLGNFGILNGPEGLDIIQDGSKWVGVVGYRNNGGKLVKLVWDNLSEPPVATDLGNFGFAGRLRDVALLKQGADYIAVLPYYNSNTLVRINFGTSMLNNPTVVNVTQSATLSGVEFPISISIVENSGSWNVVLGSVLTKTISVFDLGTDILSAPVEVKRQIFSTYNNLSKLKLVKEAKSYYGVVSTSGGSIHLIDFKQLKSTDVFEERPVLNAPRFEGVDILKDSSRHYVFGGTTNMSRLLFESSCNATSAYSEEKTPTISYSAPGTYPITLTAYDEEGNFSSITKEITITDNIAPSINFAQETQCVSNAITFTGTADQTLTAQTWDFGDGTTATGAEVSHQYTEPGTYKVQLTVESENGCGNFIEKEVNIYEAPAPDFSFPPGVVCTNGEISFTNTTPGEYKEEDITWHWDFGDGTSSEEKSPSHTYTTGGTKTVTLTASIPGCTETQEYQVTVMEGPSVNFVADHLCFGDEVQFTNLSAGDGITSFAWDFGNGETSTDENPVMEFDAAGEYEVSLTVSNAIGCSNTFTETIKINALPVVSFENAIACTGAAKLFKDKSTVANGSIAAWEWRFGDGGASTDRNPTHTFTEAGSYEVTLIVTSVAGCIDSVKQTVDVNLAPIADFEVELGCPGALTQFTNTSEDPAGDGIEVNYWIINGIYHYTPNPAVLFTKAGTYAVTLAVTSGSSCKSIVTKNIVVDPLPTPNFTFENACVGAPTSFTDQSVAFGDDEIAVWNWEFGNFETSNQQNPEVVFPGEGNYAVTLTVTTARGCSAIINKTVTISSLPEAAFAPQNNFGAPPLEVQFTNNSTGAVSYHWHFGDAEGSTSVDAEPVFVYTEVGEYEVQLIATNAGGCSDTARFTVSVLISEVDVVLERINVYTNTGNMQVVLSIRNQGTVPVENMNIRLDLGGKISLNERFTGSIAPGSSYNYPLGFDILAEDLPGVAYICASLEVLGVAKEEVNLNDNSACHDIKGVFLLTEPYPNPVDHTLNIEYFMPDDVPARIVLTDVLGNSVLDFQELNAKKGVNKFSYDFTNLAAGMYVLQISHKEESFIRRLIVQ